MTGRESSTDGSMGVDVASVAEDAPALLTLIDRRGAMRWSNARWSQFAGGEAAGGEGWLERVHDDDRPRLVAALGTARPFATDVRLRRRDNRYRWMAVHAAPRDDGMFVVSAVDVSSAREAQRALELLAAVGDELNASLAIDEVLEGVARLLVGQVADLCTIAVHDSSGRGLQRVAIAHVDKEIESELREVGSHPLDADGPSAIAQVVRSGALLYRPIVDAPGPDEPWPPLSDDLVAPATRSLICAPLRTRDDVVGALSLVTWSHRYTPDDVELAQEIAQRCAAAVENAALYRRSEDARARLALVASVGEQLSLTLEAPRMLETLARRAVPLFADSAVVALLDDDKRVLRRRAVCHVDASREEQFRSEMLHVPMSIDAREPPARAARTQRPVLIEDYSTRSNARSRRRRNDDAAADVLEVSSVLSVPLIASGGVIGVITFAFAASGRRYSPSDVPLALDLARRGALAIERGRAFDAEHRLAETLQRSMLPDALPEIPGLSLCARYLPGGKVDVGGDWYDVIPLPAGRYGIAIGDVAGHGLRAATVMGQLRHALRAFASDGHDPATVLARLNRFVFEQGPFDMATLCYGVLDPTRGRIEITTAGHLPPLILRADDDAAFVDVRPAPPIGAEVTSRYGTVSVDMAPGSTLIFYTDGLIERRGETLDAGFRRLQDAVRFAPPFLDATCDRLIDRLLGPRRPADDVAIIALRYVGTARGNFRMRRPARPGELAPVRRTLAAWLETADVGSDDIGSIIVAVSEAATNAIEHAYGPAEGWFEIDARVDDGRAVTVVVRDCGRWRPKARGGGGRGVSLIGRLMDDFELRRRPTGTEVWMRRNARGKTTTG